MLTLFNCPRASTKNISLMSFRQRGMTPKQMIRFVAASSTPTISSARRLIAAQVARFV